MLDQTYVTLSDGGGPREDEESAAAGNLWNAEKL